MASDLSTFSRKASTWPQNEMVPHVSAIFWSMTLKNKTKFNVFAAPRLNQIKIPSKNDLCEFLLIKLLHQRLPACYFNQITRHWYAWLQESEQRRVNMHSALKHLNTVDNKKCKYAMHIVMSSSFEQTSRSDIETQINP